jgi:NADH-quinone oxidoreductase subunit N
MNTPVPTLASLAPALPEIYLTAAICIVLLADAFLGERGRRITPTLTLLVLAIGAAITLAWAQVGGRVELFSGLYVADPLATLLKLFGFLVTAVALLYSRDYLDARGINRGEYYVLVLTSLLGVFVMVSANNLLTMYVGIELLALSLYAIVAFDRDSGVAAESAMKYFVLGAIASGCLLYGMSMVYGLTGALGEFTELSRVLVSEPSLGVVLGVVFIVVGVAFKFGAVPFHMWVPDVYHGAPSAVTLFVATAPKIASFALGLPAADRRPRQHFRDWTQMLAIVAALSMTIGNLVAIAQTNLKRMLAYSAIGNVGFILLGFVAGTEQGYQAALYYTIVYVIMAVGGFGMIILLSRETASRRTASTTSGAECAQPVVRGRDADADVQHGGRAALRRVLGQTCRDPGGVSWTSGCSGWPSPPWSSR